MFGRTYEPKRVFRKKTRRPFPKELVKEVNSGEDLFSVLFVSNIKEIRQKAKSNGNGKIKKKEKNAGKATAVHNLSVVQELSEPSQCKESDKENAAESTFDEVLKGPRYQTLHLPSHGKSTPAPDKNGFSLMVKSGKSNRKTQRPLSQKKLRRSGRVLRSHESQPNADDSYLDLLNDEDDDDDKAPPLRGRRNESSGNKVFSANSGTDSKDSESALHTVSFQVPSAAASSQGNGFKVDKIENTVQPSFRNNSCTNGKVTSTPSFSKFKTTFMSCDLSPIVYHKSNMVPKTQTTVETLLENDFIRESHCPPLEVEEMRGSVNSENSRPNGAVKKRLSGENCWVSNPDIFDSNSVAGDFSVMVISGTIEAEKSQKCASQPRLSAVKSKIVSTEKSLGESISQGPLPSTESKSSVVKKSSGRKCEEEEDEKCLVLEDFPSPDPFASSLLDCQREMEKRDTFSDSYDPVKRGGRRLSVMYENVNTQRGGHSSVWNRTSRASHRYSSNQPAPRRSHVVVPLHESLVAGHRASLFRDAHLNSSLLGVEEPTFEKKEEVSFKDVVLQRCNQEDILNFDEAFPESCLKNCKKIGEGVYGEVFSCQRSCDLFTVLKIMPVEGDININDEIQKTYEEILSEIVIAMELSELRKGKEFQTEGFPELISCWCVQGKYPKRLVELWREYDDENDSYNDCPDMLLDDQVFVILELANVGTSLEGFTFTCPEQAWATYLQVAYSLAVAEAAFEFEHRDLHWGNILLKPTKARTVSCTLHDKEYTVQCRGLQAFVIDFTLSRMTYDGCCIFNNMAEDPELFEGKGDFQFDVYRMMQRSVKDNWQLFEPYTNVLWLKYLIDKLITKSKYRNKSDKISKKKMDTFKMLKKKILECKSAGEVTQYCRENM